jgi:hypothetical protein
MVPGGKPIFVDVKTGKQIPLGWANESAFEPALNDELLIKKMLEGDLDKSKLTLGSVLKEVFQK